MGNDKDYIIPHYYLFIKHKYYDNNKSKISSFNGY